jgi:hypothetical protein
LPTQRLWICSGDVVPACTHYDMVDAVFSMVYRYVLFPLFILLRVKEKAFCCLLPW